MNKWTKRSILIGAGIGAALLVARSFRTTPVLVDVAVVQPGELMVTVDDDGRTRVRERFTISAPVGGRLLRTPLDPGDEVVDGSTLVAEFAPTVPSLLDVRSKTEAEARIGRAQAAVQEAEARRDQAETDQAFAAAEVERFSGLYEKGLHPKEELDRMERDERRAAQGARAATFGVQVAKYELELALASLVEPGGTSSETIDQNADVRIAPDGRLLLRSPIDGRVLRVFEESARTLAAGTPILEVGATGALEIVADYLSQDAVKITAGMQVLVEGWGGIDEGGNERVLEGRVRVVEPGGFTKVSALGVEEQRVNVIVDPAGDPELWSTLGDGYRVELRIILWRGDGVLLVPTGALFREGESWAVFVVEDGRTVRRTIDVGRMSGLEAEVRSGLVEGDRVVLYPSELVGAGTPVSAR